MEAENPFHPVGALLRGHEFHYSRCVALGELEPTLRLSPGVGMSGPGHRAKGLAAEGPDNLKSRDGLLVRNTFAGVHAPLCSSRPALGRPLRRRLPEKCLIPREGGVSSKSHTPPSPRTFLPTRFILSATLGFEIRFDAPTLVDETPAIVAPPPKKKGSMICSVIFS